ncbi:MAG: ABC-type lipoprotein export system ATPase subunit [Phenylobacterium sp.]
MNHEVLIIDSIRTHNIQYTIGGRKILSQQADFVINRHDLVCISGPSGGGKTTLLNLLCGLCKPDQGDIYWGDHQIHPPGNGINIDQLRMDWISMVFQEPRLAKQLSGWENIYLPLKIAGRFDTLDKPLLAQLLRVFFLDQAPEHHFGASASAATGAAASADPAEAIEHHPLFATIDDKLRRPVATFSSGQMQRIAIIRAIMTLPRYILADEILNSVEPELQDNTWQVIKHICRQRQIGFVLVTHNQALLNDPDFSQTFRIADGAFA